MEGFTYTNIFETKGIEYLVIISFFAVLVPLWMFFNRKTKHEVAHQKEQSSKDASKPASSHENTKATNPNHIEKILKSTITNPKTEPDSNKPQKDNQTTWRKNQKR
jgi:hypothetical protein